MATKPTERTEFARFEAAVGHVFTVPKVEVDKRIEAEKKEKEKARKPKAR